MLIKFPKGFYNTAKNIEDGVEFDSNQPVFVDLRRKKDQRDNWTTEHEVVFKFKKPLYINQFAF